MSKTFYTETEGRYYVDGIWVGNFYVDSNGEIRDTETNTIIA